MSRGYLLGLDTSNYTTSAARYDPESSTVCQSKKLLPVGQGELGLRQSDALFHHVRGLGERVQEVMEGCDGPLLGVCVSDRPRTAEGSYMPCFLAGVMAGECIAGALGIPLWRTSHQVGHVLAALWSAGQLALLNQDFLALHVSGGTFELLRVTPDPVQVIRVQILAHTLDISPGQLIDRTGLLLGLPFPAGPHLEQLAKEGKPLPLPKIILKNGCCCLSGMENKAKSLLEAGTSPADLALLVLETAAVVVAAMTEWALGQTGPLPVVFSGGVLSNALIRERLLGENRWFSEPACSADNAVGIAVAGAVFYRREWSSL